MLWQFLNKVMKNILPQPCVALAVASVTAQNYEPSPDLEALHVPFDALLDLHVRDGLCTTARCRAIAAG